MDTPASLRALADKYEIRAALDDEEYAACMAYHRENPRSLAKLKANLARIERYENLEMACALRRQANVLQLATDWIKDGNFWPLYDRLTHLVPGSKIE